MASNVQFFNAVKQGNVELLAAELASSQTPAQLLMQTTNFGPTGRNTTALHMAIVNSQVKIVQFLLNEESLVKLYGEEMKKAITFLKTAKTARNGQTAIHLALENYHADSNQIVSPADSLVLENANLSTPLQATPAASSTSAIINLLLNSGIDLSTPDADGQLPIHCAVLAGVPLPIFSLLIKLGADPKSTNEKGETLLHMCAIKSNIETAQVLLDQKLVQVNQLDEIRGMSALHLAAYSNNPQMVQLLLKYGADTTLVAKNGKSAYEIVIDEFGPEYGHEVAEMIAKQTPADAMDAILQRLQIPAEIRNSEGEEDFLVPDDDDINDDQGGLVGFQNQEQESSSSSLVEDKQGSLEEASPSIQEEQKQQEPIAVVVETVPSADAAAAPAPSADNKPVQESLLYSPSKSTASSSSSQSSSQLPQQKQPQMPQSPASSPMKDSHKKHIESITNYIKSHNYPVEVHTVQTSDGYLLNMFRIPHGSDRSLKLHINEEVSPEELEMRKKKKRPVVFLQHGCFNSSSTWVVCGPNQGLAFLLADSGFDVFMGNNRGTQFAREHISLSDKQPEFWKFSWHEFGVFDFPAQINYVINFTQVPSLTYVGHSQGTTQAFVAMSTNVEIQSKINLFIGLAPVASLANQTSNSLRFLSVLGPDSIFSVMASLGMSNGEFASSNLSRSVLPQFARLISQQALWNLIMDCQLSPECLPIVVQHEPSPTSVHNLSHWNQNIRSGHFRPYDYGVVLNNKIYGAPTPADYDLSKIKVPVALFYGEKDYLSNPKDVQEYLLPKLSNKIFALYLQGLKHNDFVWGNSFVPKIWPYLLKFVAQYNIRAIMEEEAREEEAMEELDAQEEQIKQYQQEKLKLEQEQMKQQQVPELKLL